MAAGRFLYSVSMSISAEHESEFNEIYDTEHLPHLLAVPGVLSGKRYRRIQCETVKDGQRIRTQLPLNEPDYHVFYELESPAVITSNEWLGVRHLGRWSDQIRPHAFNRRYVMLEEIETGAI